MAGILKCRAIAKAVVAKIKELPDGTMTSTSGIVAMIYGHFKYAPNTKREYDYGEFALETFQYFDLEHRVRKLAEKEGILLDNSQWAGQPTGLPFNCSYIIRHHGGKKL